MEELGITTESLAALLDEVSVNSSLFIYTSFLPLS